MKPLTLLPPALATAMRALRGAIGSFVVLAFLVSGLPCMAESFAEAAKAGEVAVECEARVRVKAPRERRERSLAHPTPQRGPRLPADGVLAATASLHPAPIGSPVPLRC